MAVDSIFATIGQQVTGAIRQAAKSTGISFEYLLTTAKIESNLNPSAQAPTSSAKGLYQFIDQTWLGTLKKGGSAVGLGQFASAITQSADGRFDVSDPAARAAIMKLRSDPAASAMMAGAFTRANAAQLQSSIGRAPSEGELYIAHFMGPDGAARLIGAATSQPAAKAADLFPQAAAANPSIFYDGAGRARSTSAVYAKLSGRFETARAVSFAPAQRSNTTATMTPPDTAGVTQAFAQAKVEQPPLPDTKPLFQAMFTDRARAAVTQTVSSLWAPSAKTNEPARPLDLFTDSATNTRKLFGSGA